jgi:predicted dienelactone hydrolase
MIGRHLASRGFIVAAPDFPLSGVSGVIKVGTVPEIIYDVVNQPRDLSLILDTVLADFGAAADSDRIGATGHSMGGLTTLLVTYHRDLRDPRIRAALPLGPPACLLTRRFYRTVDTPLLVMHGDTDQVVSFGENARPAFRGAQRPKFLVRLENGSHLGFATFALGLDPAAHYDGLGCAFLAPFFAGLDPQDPYGFFASVLGGSDAGIESRCSFPCGGGIPDRGAMSATRHTQLTRVAEAANFEAYLRGDETARCFLRRTLKREPDVRMKSSGAGRPAE